MLKLLLAVILVLPAMFAVSCYAICVYDPHERCFEQIEMGMKAPEADVILKQYHFVRHGMQKPYLVYLHEDDGRVIALELASTNSDEIVDKLLGKRESAVERLLGFLDL